MKKILIILFSLFSLNICFLYAKNANINSSRYTEHSNENRKYALVIGIGNYQGDVFDKLSPIPENDARDICKVLQELEYNVIPVINKGKEYLLSRLNELGDKAKGAKEVLIYFSGHGAYSDDGELYLALSGLHNREALKESCYSYESLMKVVKKIQVPTRLIFIDACRTNIEQNKAPFRSSKIVIKEKVRNEGIYCFFATSKGDPAKIGYNYSIFTNAFLNHIGEYNGFDKVWENICRDVEGYSTQKPEVVLPDTIQSYKEQLNSIVFNPQKKDLGPLVHKLFLKRHFDRTESVPFHLSAAINYPFSFRIAAGANIGEHIFLDLGVGTPFMKSSKIEVRNSAGNLIATQSYSMYEVKARCGYMKDFNKWCLGGYVGYSWGVINGDNPKLSAGGANIHSLVPGFQIEYLLAKRIALFANVEYKCMFSKNPSVNYDKIIDCCQEVNDWANPLGIGIGLKFNLTKK